MYLQCAQFSINKLQISKFLNTPQKFVQRDIRYIRYSKNNCVALRIQFILEDQKIDLFLYISCLKNVSLCNFIKKFAKLIEL